MLETNCSVSGCDSDSRRFTAGYCSAHYNRLRLTGSVGSPSVKRARRPDKFCSVTGCGKPHLAKGFCEMHYERVSKFGDPEKTNTNWGGDSVGYAAVHTRVRKLYGSASEYDCIKCGKPADEWAYDTLDANANTDERGYDYSLNPAHYMPMCKADHNAFDLNHRNARKEVHV